jgi:hypothetical protein
MNIRLLLLLLITTAPLACPGQTTAAPLPNPGATPAQAAAAMPGSPVALVTNMTPGNQILEAVSFDDLPLTDAIQQLAKLAGLTCQIDPELLNRKAADGTRIPPPTVKEKWRNVSPLQALDALSENYGCQVLWGPGPNPQPVIYAGGAVDPRVKKVNLLDKTPAAGALAAPANAGPGDEIVESMTFDNLAVTDAIRQLAVLAGLNIQIDPQLFNPLDANHQPIPPPAAKPTLVQTPFGQAEIFKPIPSRAAIQAPTINEKYTNITPRQAMQKLLDKYGLQLTQIPGNPILRVVAQDAKSPDAPANPTLLR